MSSDAATLVLIAFAHGEYLALPQDQFAEARARGKLLARVPPEHPEETATEEPLLTAEQMEARTSIPATWFLEQARKNALPHVRLGKYVRFRFSEVGAACERKAK